MNIRNNIETTRVVNSKINLSILKGHGRVEEMTIYLQETTHFQFLETQLEFF